MIDSPVKVPRELNRKRRVRWYEGYLKIRFFCFSRKVTYGILVYGTKNLTVKGHVETTCAGNARVCDLGGAEHLPRKQAAFSRKIWWSRHTAVKHGVGEQEG